MTVGNEEEKGEQKGKGKNHDTAMHLKYCVCCAAATAQKERKKDKRKWGGKGGKEETNQKGEEKIHDSAMHFTNMNLFNLPLILFFSVLTNKWKFDLHIETMWKPFKRN